MPAQNAHIKPVIGTTPSGFNSPQAHFERQDFDDFISDKGYEADLERSVKCPCVIASGGSASSQCLNCGGSGYFFIDKWHSVVACTGIGNMVKNQPWSQVNAGTISVSTKAQDRLGYFDRITLTELEMIYSQNVKVFRNSTQQKIFFFTTYKPITIYEIYLFKDFGQQHQLITTDQFSIDYNKIVLDWNTFNSLFADDSDYVSMSIVYTHNPVYQVIDINRHLIRQWDEDKGEKSNFPLHCVARLTHFMYDNPDLLGTSLYDNTSYTRTPINYDYGSDSNAASTLVPYKTLGNNKELIYFNNVSNLVVPITPERIAKFSQEPHADVFYTDIAQNRAVLVNVPVYIDVSDPNEHKLVFDFTGPSTGFLMLY